MIRQTMDACGDDCSGAQRAATRSMRRAGGGMMWMVVLEMEGRADDDGVGGGVVACSSTTPTVPKPVALAPLVPQYSCEVCTG
jgi:hypothetical protein